MKWYFMGLFAVWMLSACSEGSSVESSTLSARTSQSAELVSWEGYRDVDGSYRSDSAAFVVHFPQGEVVYERSEMQSKAGPVDYHTFIHSVTGEQDHMVSVSIYPVELVVAKGRAEMLDDAFKGIARGLGQHDVDLEEDFSVNNLPAKRFMLNNGQWYMRAEQLMINENLYQKVILKQGAYVSDSIAQPFFKSFHLLN